MTRFTKSAALAAALIAGAALSAPALASSDEAAPFGDAYLGKSIAEVQESLTSKGYEVRGMEMEDGYIEGYAMKDGKRYELYVDPKTGKVAKQGGDD